MKILVIGGMGVIGGAITTAAAEKKWDVVVVSRRELSSEWIDRGVSGIAGDWRDDNFARNVVKVGFDVIIDTQVFNEKQLARSMEVVNGHCKQYIYISTDSVYAHPAKNLGEDEPINLSEIYWEYGINKRKAELYLLNNGNKYKFFWTGIRPTITFGDTRIPVGYATKRSTYTLAERIIEGRPIIRFDDPNSRHSVCHTSIFGSAAVGLFLNEKAYSQFFHISDDQAYSYDEIFTAIEKVLGKKALFVNVSVDCVKKYSKTIYEEMVYDKNPEFTLDTSKIKSVVPDINYHVDIDTVMESTLSYLKGHSIGKDDEYNYISDSILMNQVNSIDNHVLREQVNNYISKFSKEYVNELTSFEKKQKVKNILYPLKRCKWKLKHMLFQK